jgi:hypothetical protein
LFFGSVPLLRAGIELTQLQVQTRCLRAQTQCFAKFPFGGRHVSQDGVILRHHLMSARRIRETSLELIKNLFGEQAGGPAIVIQQLRIIRALRQSLLQNCHGLR